MQLSITVHDLAGFDAAFSNVGARVGPRTGGGRRTQDEKEWFVVRRVLKAGLRSRSFSAPFSIEKQDPPAPDFLLKNGDRSVFLEITEATDPTDQREMTLSERRNGATLHGAIGGRFADGASQPGIVWAADVLDAIRRKDGKSIFLSSPPDRHLIIYPNSNASMLLFDAADERTACSYLTQAIAAERDAYVTMLNGCFVHILGKEYVFFDLFGKPKRVKRH